MNPREVATIADARQIIEERGLTHVKVGLDRPIYDFEDIRDNWNRAYARTLINERGALFTPRRIAAGLDSLDMKPDNQLSARWILYFIRHSIPSHIPPLLR